MTKKHLIYEENRGAQVGAPVGTNGEEIKGNLRCAAHVTMEHIARTWCHRCVEELPIFGQN